MRRAKHKLILVILAALFALSGCGANNGQADGAISDADCDQADGSTTDAGGDEADGSITDAGGYGDREGWATYTINLSAQQYWTGQINQIRIDPIMMAS